MVIYDVAIGLLSNALYDSIIHVMHGDTSSKAYNMALKELNKKYKLSKIKIDSFLQQEDVKATVKEYIENPHNYESLKSLTDEFLASFGKDNFSREYANSILRTFFEKLDTEIEKDPELRANLQIYLTKQTYLTVQETNKGFKGLSLEVQELSRGIKKLNNKLELINDNSTNCQENLIHYNPSTLPLYPYKLKQFVTENRADELRNALRYLEKHSILLINGVGGVGKSTLARALIDLRPKNFPEPFWFSFYDYQDAKVGDILERLAAYMKTPEIASFRADKREPEKSDIDRLIGELYRRSDVWLIFDDLSMMLEDQRFVDKGIEFLFSSLRSKTHNAKIIITSRVLPILENGESLLDVDDDEEVQHLCGLRTNFAVGYLASNGLKEIEKPNLEKLAKGVDGHPLALKLLVELVKKHGVTDIISDLSIYQIEKEDTIKKARKLFNKLAGNEKELLERISVYREPVKWKGLKEMFTENTPKNAIKKLIDKSLLETDKNGNYWLHPLVQEFSYEDLKNKKEAHMIAYNYYSLSLPENPTKKEDLQSAIEAHYHACEAGKYDHAYIIWESYLHNLLELWGYPKLLIEIYEKMLPKDHFKGEPILKDKQEHEAVLGNLGYAYILLGETKKAVEYYEQALKIDKEIGNRRKEGAALGNLGYAYILLGETKKAIEYNEQALKIDREVGDKLSEANCLGNLGNVFRDLGETKKAFEYYEQALKIDKEIGYRHGEGNRLGNLGNIYHDLGETKKAIDYYEQALKIARDIGYRRNEGNQLGYLGNAYYDLGEKKKAIEYYEQALKIAREIGYRHGEGKVLGNLGNAYYDLGEKKKAIESLRKSLAIGKSIEDPRIIDLCERKLKELEGFN